MGLLYLYHDRICQLSIAFVILLVLDVHAKFRQDVSLLKFYGAHKNGHDSHPCSLENKCVVLRFLSYS